MYLILKFKISLFLFSSESTNLQGAVAFSVSSENSSCGHFTITMPLWVSIIQSCASCVPFVLVYFKFVFDNRFFLWVSFIQTCISSLPLGLVSYKFVFDNIFFLWKRSIFVLICVNLQWLHYVYTFFGVLES